MNAFFKNKATKIVFWLMMILLWVAASIISAQLLVGGIMLSFLGKEDFSQPVSTAIYSAVSYAIAMLLIIFVPPFLKRCWHKNHYPKKAKRKFPPKFATRKELGLQNLVTWTDIGLAPIGYVVYLIVGIFLASIFSFFPWFDANQAQDVGFSIYMTGGDRLIAFVTLVVIAPIAEEIIFRGYLYDKIRVKLSTITTDIISIVISSLLVSVLFGLIHMQWNVGLNVFALSLVLCALREITGTIYSGILLHMIKNGLAFYLLYVVGIF